MFEKNQCQLKPYSEFFSLQIMRYLSVHFLLFFVIFLLRKVYSNELTFELPDNARECFHEKLKVGSKYILEFQVRNRSIRSHLKYSL